jgi:hypothetical protein
VLISLLLLVPGLLLFGLVLMRLRLAVLVQVLALVLVLGR